MKRTLNTTINRSKSEKNDEHYTQLADIENEVRDDGGYEVMVGQQRTISICQYFNNDFSYEERYFGRLDGAGDARQKKFLDYELTVCFCSGDDEEKIKWSERIDVAGKELSAQEMRNAVYHGPWESQADHITPWAKGGKTVAENCQMLCVDCNRRCTTISNLCGSAPLRLIQYDADGNLTDDGAFHYAYDAENRLRAVTSARQTNGAVRVLNAYDHRHRRTRKTIQRLSLPAVVPPSPPPLGEWATTETHTYVWDGINIADALAFVFSTKPLDRETGLVSYQRRFYRPPLGRFLNRDPIEEAGGENLYAFCANSPVIFTDFLGFVTATITMDTAVHLSTTIE